MLTEDGYFISKCLDGETEAFGFLVDKYKASVYAFLYSRLRNFHDAEDVTQRVFVRAYEKLGTLSSWESFARWLYTIAYSQCRNFIRECQNRPDREFVEDQNPAVLRNLSMESYRDAQINNSLREELEEAMASLPEMYSQVLILHYFGGMRVKEIATVLSITPTNVKKRLSRARAMLKEEMLAMMDTAFEGQRLQASFTFRIVESIRRVKPQLTPRTTILPWGLSLATGIMVAILGIGSYLNLSKPLAIPKDLPITSEMQVFKVNDIIINAPEEPKTVVSPNQQWIVDNEKSSDPHKAPLLAPKGAGIELTTENLQEGDSFGMDNCIYGEYAIVGAPWTDNYKGVAYIFRYNGTTWVEEEKLAAGDALGAHTCISGDYALVGATAKNGNTGAAYSFKRNGTFWEERAKITLDDASSNMFGYAISISGDNAIIGAPRHNSKTGAAYIYSCKADLSLSVNPASHTITTFGGMKSNVITSSIEARSSAPMEFRLLENYPNPFNPETWIPYQLGNDAHVKFSIYDSTGKLVRLMDLGHKPAGPYMGKDKAIYWDGRNEAGEPVSSGTYFIYLSADSFSSTRKMVMIR